MTRNYRKPEAQRRAEGEALYRSHPGGNPKAGGTIK